MISYLADTSALWHLFRTPETQEAWADRIASGALSICEPTRTEFLHSATGPAHRDELEAELNALCRLAAVPKSAWRWVENAQYKLTPERAGTVRRADRPAVVRDPPPYTTG
ncbi:PIN domain-containing protein [Streptosporangium vulgare]|uniref:PIN domain-containing protein n=1 Tax=Streptosporangium vulgare TaxID=46190 RepID=UPI0031D1B5B4